MSFPPNVPLLEADSAELLWTGDYLPALIASLEEAQNRVDVAMFMTGVGTQTVAQGRVRQVLDILARLQQRGVACRVLVNDFSEDVVLPTVNQVAAHYLDGAGVPVRLFRNDRGSSVHSKYVLIDQDVAIVGSGNWTGGGLIGNLEAAVRVVSRPLVRTLQRRFDRDWQQSVPPEPLP